jgi:hypothetical protein
MSTEELKLQMFRQIDSLEGQKLRELYGVVQNYLSSKVDPGEWVGVSNDHQASILEAIEELDQGKSKPHSELMSQLRLKYGKSENN